MRVAFDYHGTLDTYPYLSTMIRTFKQHDEHKMYVLTAVSQDEYKTRLKEVEEWMKNNHIIMKHIIDIVEGGSTHQGKSKLEKMKEHSIDVLFDNDPVIVGIVKRGGRDAVLV